MPNPFKRYPTELWLHFLGRVIIAMGYAFSFPFVTIYAVKHMNVPTGDVGLAVCLSMFVGAIARLCGGELADRIRRKTVMQLALGGRAVTSALVAWQVHRGAGFVAFAATFIASNFFGQLFEPASQAYVADITSGKTRTESFGFVRTGINAGWGIGMLLNALVTDNYVLPFAVTSGVFAISLVLFAVFLKEPKRALRSAENPARWSGVAANKPFLLLALGAVLIAIAWAQLVPGTSFYASEIVKIPEKHIKLLFVLNGVLVVLLQLPATRVMARVGLLPALVTGCCLYAVGYGSYTFCSHAWHFALCIVAVTMGEVLCAPSGPSLATELAPDSQRGRYLGAYMFCLTAGQACGPLLSGYLLQIFPARPAVTWATIAGAALASALVHATVGRWYGVGKGPPRVLEKAVKEEVVGAA